MLTRPTPVSPRGYDCASHAMTCASDHAGRSDWTRARAFRSSGLVVNVPQFGWRKIALQHLDDLVFARTEREQELRVRAGDVVNDADRGGGLQRKPGVLDESGVIADLLADELDAGGPGDVGERRKVFVGMRRQDRDNILLAARARAAFDHAKDTSTVCA